MATKLQKCRDVLAGKNEAGEKVRKSCRDEEVISLANGESLKRAPLAAFYQMMKSALSDKIYSFEKYSYLVRDQELIDSIKSYYQQQDVTIEDNQVAIDSGSSRIFVTIFRYIIDTELPVFIGAGFYHSFVGWALKTKVNLIKLDSKISYQYKLTCEAIEEGIQLYGIPSAVVLINPGYLGDIYTKEEMGAILELSRKYGFLIVEDSIFQGCEFENQTVPLLSLAKPTDQVIAVNSPSKRSGLSNIRIGWAAGKKEHIDVIQNVADVESVSLPFLFTKMTAVAIRDSSCYYERQRKELQRRANFICKLIQEVNSNIKDEWKNLGADVIVNDIAPKSGQNIVLRFPYFEKLKRFTFAGHEICDSADLSLLILQEINVALSPCYSNGIDGFSCRISFAGVNADQIYPIQNKVEQTVALNAMNKIEMDFNKMESELWDSIQNILTTSDETFRKTLQDIQSCLLDVIENINNEQESEYEYSYEHQI